MPTTALNCVGITRAAYKYTIFEAQSHYYSVNLLPIAFVLPVEPVDRYRTAMAEHLQNAVADEMLPR